MRGKPTAFFRGISGRENEGKRGTPGPVLPVSRRPPASAPPRSWPQERRPGAIFLVLALSAATLLPATAQDEERVRKLFQDAIETMGGEAFLKVADVVSEGNFFVFDRDGNSFGLIKYFDYTKFPDRSRNELGNKKKLREITVFNLEKEEGWILEGQKETRDATPAEMKSFKNSVKHSLDVIMRYRYQNPENKLFYVGPGEGSEVRLELVQLLDPENDTVTIYFDRMSKLPAKIEYKNVDKRGVHLREVDEFGQWHEFAGVKVPLRIDHYTNGRKSWLLYLTKVTLNNNLDDSFFSRPIPPK